MVRFDPQRERIQDDLRGLVAGEVRCDDFFLQLHASDASFTKFARWRWSARTSADAAACVRYAREQQLSVHAHGAGTGLAGESLGPGIVVDFSKYLRHVIRIDADKIRAKRARFWNG